MEKTLPFGDVFNSIDPSIRSTSVFTMARPSPLELSPAVGLALNFLNFWYSIFGLQR